ncbi:MULTISPECIES: hypothetical protein [Spirulina sp. CCY15215]|uniref:hypothetical protein n=1 Tax=Spirulina sp. CCY15215 TaxID=2767591 RepID=UPI00194DC636|nr:hypothetical protein [Spirulina major]
MTKVEIIASLKQLTSEERLEIIEIASQMTREEIKIRTYLQEEQKQNLRLTAEAAKPLYQKGGELYDLFSPESEDYFASKEELLEYISREELSAYFGREIDEEELSAYFDRRVKANVSR